MTAIRIDHSDNDDRSVTIEVEGRAVTAQEGESIAAALMASGILALRVSPRDGGPRGAVCFMGICQECVVHVNGVVRQACLTPVAAGQKIALGGAG